jgi:biotin carboxyl carrier protein
MNEADNKMRKRVNALREGGKYYIVTATRGGTCLLKEKEGATRFVKLDDKIESGKKICTINDGGKLYEIIAKIAGKVDTISVSHKDKVVIGQPLFRIEKL